MTSAPPAGWTARQRAIAARRPDQCTVCGHKRTVQTEAGPLCRAHAVDAPPPLTRPEHDEDLDSDGQVANVVQGRHDEDQEDAGVRPT